MFQQTHHPTQVGHPVGELMVNSCIDISSGAERDHCSGVWDTLTWCTWGLHKTYSEMFREVTKGRERERVHVSPHCVCMRRSDHHELGQGCGIRNSYVQVPATGENSDPGEDTGQTECLSSATEEIHTDYTHTCKSSTNHLSSWAAREDIGMRSLVLPKGLGTAIRRKSCSVICVWIIWSPGQGMVAGLFYLLAQVGTSKSCLASTHPFCPTIL